MRVSRHGTKANAEPDDRAHNAIARLNALDRSRSEEWAEYVHDGGDGEDEDEDEGLRCGTDSGNGSGSKYSWTKALLVEANVRNNRYRDIASWDHALLPGPYLNASLIPPLPLPLPASTQPSRPQGQAYIASQAPPPHTFPAFFAHLCAQRVRVLVMLTPLTERGLKKADQYWPSAGGGERSIPVRPTLSSRSAHLFHHQQKQREQQLQQQSGGATSTTRSVNRRILNLPSSDWAVEVLEEQDLSTGPSPSSSSSSSASSPSPRPLPSGTHLQLRRLRLHIETRPSPSECILASQTPSGPSSERAGLQQNLNTTSGSATHDLVQLHLSSWADYGTDSLDTLDILLDWIDHLQLQESSPPSPSPSLSQPPPPIWIHCSAGVGRSGTVIAAHMLRNRNRHLPKPKPNSNELIKMTIPEERDRAFLLADCSLEHEHEADADSTQRLAEVIAVVAYLRRFRPMMVQTPAQLEMVCGALAAATATDGPTG
ncbi:unnamed protein product [Tilletia laevis]|nr:unnamed protein product [Tilletia laevis]